MHEEGAQEESKVEESKDLSNEEEAFKRGSDSSSDQEMFSTKYKLLTTFFVIILLWHPTIINYSFSVFMCADYEDGYSYLRKDTSIRCWEGRNLVL